MDGGGSTSLSSAALDGCADGAGAPPEGTTSAEPQPIVNSSARRMSLFMDTRYGSPSAAQRRALPVPDGQISARRLMEGKPRSEQRAQLVEHLGRQRNA